MISVNSAPREQDRIVLRGGILLIVSRIAEGRNSAHREQDRIALRGGILLLVSRIVSCCEAEFCSS
jgi:hypothetical protein